MLKFAFLSFPFAVAAYLYAFFALYRIVKSERPEWVKDHSSAGSFWHLQGPGDPNVQLELLRIAYGVRARELRSPLAALHVRLVRWLLPIGIILFALIAWGTVGAP